MLLVLPGGEEEEVLGGPDPRLLLVLLGVVLEVLAQAAGVRVPLVAPGHVAPVRLLRSNKCRLHSCVPRGVF